MFDFDPRDCDSRADGAAREHSESRETVAASVGRDRDDDWRQTDCRPR